MRLYFASIDFYFICRKVADSDNVIAIEVKKKECIHLSLERIIIWFVQFVAKNNWLSMNFIDDIS